MADDENALPEGELPPPFNEILKKEKAERERKEREDAEAELHQRRQSDRMSAYESMIRLLPQLRNTTLNKQEFATACAKEVVTFALKDFYRSFDDLKSDGNEARDCAVEILKVASKGDANGVVRLLLALMASAPHVPNLLWNRVIDQVDEVALEIMGFWEVRSDQPLPGQNPGKFRLSQLELYRSVAEQWRAVLVREDWRERVANKIAHEANAAERRLWPETMDLGKNRTFLAVDALGVVENLLKRINAELSQAVQCQHDSQPWQPDSSKVPEPLPLPKSIETIADSVIRQRATDAWRAASQLRRLMETWEAWLLQLESTGDANGGLAAVRFPEAIVACLEALYILKAEIPTFRQKPIGTLAQQFPRLLDYSIDWQKNPENRQLIRESIHGDRDVPEA